MIKLQHGEDQLLPAYAQTSHHCRAGLLPAIPSLGLGVYESEGLSCKATVLEALKVGYRLIDTAQFYRNERWVGEAIREVDMTASEDQKLH